jgi:adenylosuccinate lyase
MHQAISSIDGRYSERTRSLAHYFSEEGLMRHRVLVECEYLISLTELGQTSLRKFSASEIITIRDIYEKFGHEEYHKIKDFEATTNHDVKAVEYFIKAELEKTSLKDTIEWVHFALTSEDTNNVAYALVISESLEKVIVPELETIQSTVEKMAKDYKDLAMLARTHGQAASPTTFGKEMKVYSARIQRELKGLELLKIQAKLNGATGNYNAHYVTYPKIDWVKFTETFISDLNVGRRQKLEANIFTTQIECHDSYVAVFDALRRINTILLDYNQDIWRYISDGWIGQKTKAGETGSSTMPHKVNPIDFENSEGNLGLANAMFEFFARKLPISRLQRDLSDSTVERNFGTAFAHSLVAYHSLLKGLGKITVNEIKIKKTLEAHPEVIAEAIQTVLRREGAEFPYEKLKELTRGKAVTMEDFKKFIENLQVSASVKNELLAITPLNYTGLASKLASM